MRIRTSTLYTYCREGRPTGQVPNIEISLVRPGQPQVPEDQTFEEIPDGWLIHVDSNYLPTTSTNCFTFWSVRGLRENEARLRAEFKTREGCRDGEKYDRQQTFQSWYARAMQDAVRSDDAVAKKLVSMRKKLAAYEAFQQARAEGEV